MTFILDAVIEKFLRRIVERTVNEIVKMEEYEKISEKIVFWVRKWLPTVLSQESAEHWFSFWLEKLGNAKKVHETFPGHYL